MRLYVGDHVDDPLKAHIKARTWLLVRVSVRNAVGFKVYVRVVLQGREPVRSRIREEGDR